RVPGRRTSVPRQRVARAGVRGRRAAGPGGRARAGPGGGRMRIAMVSEHASPLAILGGEDAGGQNVHVAALATQLARLGARVDVFTRRDDAERPAEVELVPG